MIGALFLRYSPYLVAVAAVFLIGFWAGGIHPRSIVLEERALHAQQREAWEKLRADYAARALKKQQELELSVATAREDLAHAKQEIDLRESRIARITLDAAGMRSKLAAFASHSGGSDTVSSCQQRAAVLAGFAAEGGELLAEGAELSRQAARYAEERAAEVRALLNAWPKASGESVAHRLP